MFSTMLSCNQSWASPMNRTSSFFFLCCAFFLHLSSVFAQFRVVDAEDGEPIAYAYILSPRGSVLEMTDSEGRASAHHGKVRVTMLSYESQTVDADSVRNGEVRLKLVGFPLHEASAASTDFLKFSTAFRDVFRNDGRIVLYREGIVDYYYDFATHEMSRKVRGERRFVHPNLFKVGKNKPNLYDDEYLNLCRTVSIEHPEKIGERGDTTIYKGRVSGFAVDSVSVCIRDPKHHLFRAIIRQHTCPAPVSKLVDKLLRYRKEKDVIDWMYSDEDQAWSHFIGARSYRRCQLGKKPILEESTKDVVVTDRCVMSAAEMRDDAKRAERLTDFVLPDNMPDVGIDNLEEALEGLECKE